MTRFLPRLTLALLALLALIVAIDNLERPLANPDEGRYSEIAREMAASGDWVTPRLNGFKYFEKPPLQYWATAALFTLFGVSEYTARIYVALCGLLTLVAVGFTARRLVSEDAALLSVAVLVSSPYFMALGGIVTLDIGLTAWLTVAAGAFLIAQARSGGERERRGWMLVAWAGIALAILSKGLIGLLIPAAAIFLHCLLSRDWGLLKRLEWLRGLAVLAVITVPWFVLVARANPEFTRFFFVHEHFERFLTTVHRRSEPWWYFIPILFAGFLPWMAALVPACVAAWRREDPAHGFAWQRFALAWALFVLVFFSASGSKLPAYILPAFPMLALVLGAWLERTEARRIALYLAPVLLVIAVALAVGWEAPERAKSAWVRELYLAARPWIAAGAIVLFAGIATAVVLLHRGRKPAAFAVLLTACLMSVDCFEDGYEALSPRQSSQDMAEVMRPWIGPRTRVYSVRYYEHALPFYLRREVILAQYVDEFALGQASEPHKYLGDVEAFIVDWARPGDAVAIMQPGLLQYTLAPRGIPLIVLHADEKRVVVRKP